MTAHASMPEAGADAIAGLAFVITYIRKKIAECPVHPELGRSTVTFGQIRGGYSPYVVPDQCMATVDMRLVPPVDTKKAKKIVREAVAYGEQQVPGVKGSYTVTGDRPSINTPGFCASGGAETRRRRGDGKNRANHSISRLHRYSRNRRDAGKHRMYVLWTGQSQAGS